MTTATCIYCGNLKFGAFNPCPNCDRVPVSRSDVVRSLVLTDHYYNQAQLEEYGHQVSQGLEISFDPTLEGELDSQVDERTLKLLERGSDPAYRESCYRRERNIILLLITLVLSAIAWMTYRFIMG